MSHIKIMSDIAIRVENLSKRYRIGRAQQRHDTLRDSLAASLRSLGQWGSRNGQTPSDDFWALKDVSFEVKQGEVVGIIGRNGAGKSTLLKILSQITEPTSGRVELHGRVASLLEVGTGFHPELSGRENIYLNGAILGMRRTEINQKFDEIVAFAEIEKFLDTPVKHYSSGMYVRLAFAVAAHLEPEILLVDEVLAVGDAAFQKKCLGKMGDVAKQGRTVLFVSHNMGAISTICPTSILLQSGQMLIKGDSTTIIDQYLGASQQKIPDIFINPSLKPNAEALLIHCWLADPIGNPITMVNVSKNYAIGLSILANVHLKDIEVSVRFSNSLGLALFVTNLSNHFNDLTTLQIGIHSFLVHIPAHFLVPGLYFITISIHLPGHKIFDEHEQIMNFQIIETGSKMWYYPYGQYGNIFVNFHWQKIDAK